MYEIKFRPTVSTQACFFYLGELVQVVDPGHAVAGVKNLDGKHFEAAIKHFEMPPKCIHESTRTPGFCLCGKEPSGDCLTYFCKSKSYSPVTGNLI